MDLHLSALFALSDANASPLLENNWFVLRARDHINYHLWEELNVFLEQHLDVLVDVVQSH